MKVVTVEEMRRLDAACMQEAGISTDVLMENAGLAVAEKVRELLGDVSRVPVLVLVGPGNNGGDGLVVARHLQEWDARVTVYVVAPRPPDDPKLTQAEERGVMLLDASSDPGLESFRSALSSARLAVDAILGTGHLRPLQGTVREVMMGLGKERDQRRELTLVALDLPTGLDGDTGAVDPATPAFDVTVTLAFPKAGLFRFPGAATVGRLETVDIGIPSCLAEEISCELLTAQWVAERLPSRPLDAHKGTFGRLLIVAGSRNYVGAASLAAEAAYRVGAGLVTLAAPASIYPILAASTTEATHLPLPEGEPGRLNEDAVPLVAEELARCDALLVGCGMGQYPDARLFLERLLFEKQPRDLPVIVDADGLNNLAQVDSWWERIASPAILTPHPGEMARLSGISAREVQEDRLDTARTWAARWGKVVVLKGAFSVVASPQGLTQINPFANPALASGGTGDVLAGAIGGLLAQGMAPVEAAACGVYLHGAAGEEARDDLGDTGVIATDLLPLIPRVIKRLRAG